MSFKPTPQHRDLAHRLLKESGIPRDRLPYTEPFLELHIKFVNAADLAPGDYPSYEEFWRLLCGAAKKGGLAREPKEEA